MRVKALIITVAALTVAGLFAIPGAPASAGINPADFSSPVANPYFPLKPGTVFVYRGSEGRQRLVEHLRITHDTKTIQGVQTIVISDVLHSNGRLAEATHDYYADDNGGTTWYFGEQTATYDKHGHVQSREGSWLAAIGRDQLDLAAAQKQNRLAIRRPADAARGGDVAGLGERQLHR